MRTSKTVGANTTQYAWGRSLLVQEKTGTNTTSYIYGPGGTPLELITPAAAAYYYHHDQLGSTRALTDVSGVAQATDTFDPYGNVTTSTGSVVNPLLFSGQYRDSESGLYYLRARYYAAATGQFMSRDPLVAMTRSPYAYVSGNPLNGSDPSGLLSLCDVGNWLGNHKAIVAGVALVAVQFIPGVDIAVDAGVAGEAVATGVEATDAAASVDGVVAATDAGGDDAVSDAGSISDHAAQQMASRGVSQGQVDNIIANRSPFGYADPASGEWRTGYYDSQSGILVAKDPGGAVVTVMTNVAKGYISGLRG